MFTTVRMECTTDGPLPGLHSGRQREPPRLEAPRLDVKGKACTFPERVKHGMARVAVRSGPAETAFEKLLEGLLCPD